MPDGVSHEPETGPGIFTTSKRGAVIEFKNTTMQKEGTQKPDFVISTKYGREIPHVNPIKKLSNNDTANNPRTAIDATWLDDTNPSTSLVPVTEVKTEYKYDHIGKPNDKAKTETSDKNFKNKEDKSYDKADIVADEEEMARQKAAGSGVPPESPPPPGGGKPPKGPENPEESKDDYKKALQDLLDIPESDPKAIRDPQVRTLINQAIKRGDDLELLQDFLKTNALRAATTDPTRTINSTEWDSVEGPVIARIAELKKANTQKEESKSGKSPNDRNIPPDLDTLFKVLRGDKKRVHRPRLERKPPEIKAVFRQGDFGDYAKELWGMDDSRILDVRDPDQRDLWLFLNLESLRSGAFPDYKVFEGYWVTGDLNTALTAEKEGQPVNSPIETEITKTKELLQYAISVTVAARAMQLSKGASKDYISTVTFGGSAGNPGLAEPYVLGGHPEKYVMVTENQYVAKYYDEILTDANTTLTQK